ncbi:glycosyltransferase [Sediminicoccus rosea]|jgi:glycosyltransferase involved in cell wall biosynthesis|uniref:Glycosyltransferase n=1 Tax=Sediminicoccus rosea TaxID=1225128 RepID=A0ABZ0PIG0_9PROT|nr:glycosyltransferase [Sediminicoccus rosea]WPB85471.1 glycosyltransferase [Sediminicoccus rosea]
MNQPLVLDVSRLLWRAVRAAPGGIDRLELAMAQHLLREEPSARFVFTDGGVVRVLKPAMARRLVEGASARWSGHPRDAACGRVTAYLAGAEDAFPPARARLADRQVPLVDLGRNLLAGLLYRRGVPRTAEPEALQGATYLNLSHRNLDDAKLFAALSRAGHLLCYLHDDIPLRRPNLAAPGSDQRFRRMLRHLGERPVRIVTNSAASRRRIVESAAAHGLRLARVEVIAPPVAELFTHRTPPSVAGRRFFLVPGLVTARKNLALLAEACRAMAGRRDFDLILAGAPGLDAAEVLAGLGAMPPGIRLLRAEGLSDHAMARLVRAAIAVLAPSLEEGFDYPVHEALASGVPVIASDIPAHREYVAGYAELLDARDVAGWAAALADFAAGGPRHAAARAAAGRFAAPSPARLLRGMTELARAT